MQKVGDVEIFFDFLTVLFCIRSVLRFSFSGVTAADSTEQL